MGKRYSIRRKAAAVRQFADVRPGHPSDRSALRAVADEFGVPRGTLSRWVFDPRNAEASGRAGRSGRHHSPDAQAEALRRFAEVRPDHPSDRSAQRAVAAERGIGYWTVRNWVDASCQDAREGIFADSFTLARRGVAPMVKHRERSVSVRGGSAASCEAVGAARLLKPFITESGDAVLEP